MPTTEHSTAADECQELTQRQREYVITEALRHVKEYPIVPTGPAVNGLRPPLLPSSQALRSPQDVRQWWKAHPDTSNFTTLRSAETIAWVDERWAAAHGAEKTLAWQEQEEMTSHTREGDKRPESPPSAPTGLLSSEEEPDAPTVRNECENEKKRTTPYNIEGRDRRVLSEQRPSKVRNERSRHEPADRHEANAETTNYATRRSVATTTTTSSNITDINKSSTISAAIAASSSSRITTHSGDDSPFFWHLTSDQERAFMRDMETADSLPDDGTLYHPSPAHDRLIQQYRVFERAWAAYFPHDSLRLLYDKFKVWHKEVRERIRR